MCFTKKSINILKQNDTQINKDTDSNIPNKKIYSAVYDSSGVSRQNSLVSRQNSLVGRQNSLVSRQNSLVSRQNSLVGRNNSVVSRQNSLVSTGHIKTYIINDFNWDQYDNKYIYKRKKPRYRSRYMYYE
jgi:hypothetical protein